MASVPLHMSSLSCGPFAFSGSLENFTEERAFRLFKGTLQPAVHSPALNFKILNMILYGVKFNLVKFAFVCLKFNNIMQLIS